MGKNKKAQGNAGAEPKGELGQMVEAVEQAIDPKLEAKTEKIKVKREMTKDEMYQVRVEAYGLRKALLGKILYKAAGMVKTAQPAVMERLFNKYKGSERKSKAADAAKGGMYLFDAFLKFQVKGQSKEGKLTPIAGNFFLLAEDSFPFKRIAAAANKAKNDIVDGKVTPAVIAFVLQSAVIAAASKKVRVSTGTSKRKTSESSSAFKNQVKEYTF